MRKCRKVEMSRFREKEKISREYMELNEKNGKKNV